MSHSTASSTITNDTSTSLSHQHHNNESIYYEIISIVPSAAKPMTDNDALYLNQIVKLTDKLDDEDVSTHRFDQIQHEDEQPKMSGNRLSSLNSILQNSQKAASASSSSHAATAGDGATTAAAAAAVSISNNHTTIKQLSRNSSTFSSKSHYSMRSSMTKGTGGGGIGGVGCAGSVSLSIATAGHFKPTNPSQHTSHTHHSKEQEIINQQNINNHPIDRYSIESTSNASIYSLNLNYANVKEPVIIRGAGNITIFGVCNKFNEQFPTQLNAKLAPEEFRDTIKQINNILSRELANSFRWLVFGSIFCCCTMGISLLPVIFMNKKAKLSINKLLDIENQRLYLKLGLKWKLTKMKCNSNSLNEYVLLIEILPTIMLYQPD